MLRLAAVVVSVGLADSLNPATLGPALYLATAARRVASVSLFTLGFFAVNFLAGVLLVAAPGRLLRSLLPHPHPTLKYALEIAVGVVLLALATALWAARRRLAQRPLPMPAGGSAFVTGATIAAVELPTAAPYLAIIATIIASTASLPQSILLVALFNLAFVAPLIAIVAILLVAGERADPLLRRCAAWLQRNWPVVLGALLLAAGGALTVIGAAGLIRR
jgi:cytochrome c biogenesis protein CcdA